jgi:deoxyadenosine/deoxycytidine kinase
LKEPVVAIVGVCASGKTTLAAGLTQHGIRAYSVPQEHSFVRRLWEKQHPDANVLVMLDARWETTKQRRPTISYGPDRLEEQRQRLALARESCDLYLPTDDLSIDEVRQRVLDFLATWKERA